MVDDLLVLKFNMIKFQQLVLNTYLVYILKDNFKNG